jgi:hypothetical protein
LEFNLEALAAFCAHEPMAMRQRVGETGGSKVLYAEGDSWDNGGLMRYE